MGLNAIIVLLLHQLSCTSAFIVPLPINTVQRRSHAPGNALRAEGLGSDSWLGKANLEDVVVVPRPEHLTAAAREAAGTGMSTSLDFLDMFRGSAPYIRMHHGTTMVIHIPGECFESEESDRFAKLMDEVALVSMLGARLVLVLGCTPQIKAMMKARGLTPSYVNGKMVTDAETLRVAKECAGYARFEVESALARGRTGGSFVETSGGNFFSAQPVGVREGVDFMYTGEVRRIEVDRIMDRLETGDIVHLTCLGFSPSGQIFNVETEHLAVICAIKLQAAKLIYVTRGEECLWDSRGQHTVQSLRLRDADELLALQRERHPPVEISGDGDLDVNEERRQSVLQLISYCVMALQQGVKRTHLVPPTDGSIIEELYTRFGAGMMVSRDIYEGIHSAEPADLPTIVSILAPISRDMGWPEVTSSLLEKEIRNWVVYSRDEKVVGCACLHLDTGNSAAEIGQFAVSPPFRSTGVGSALLGYMERMAIPRGVEHLWVLTLPGPAQSWLERRGFRGIAPQGETVPLPTGGLEGAKDDPRGRKLLVKSLMGTRGVDAYELLWDIGSAPNGSSTYQRNGSGNVLANASSVQQSNSKS